MRPLSLSSQLRDLAASRSRPNLYGGSGNSRGCWDARTAHQVLSGAVVRWRVLGKHLAFITLNLQSTPAAAPMGAAPAGTAPGAPPQQAVATAAVAFLSAELLPPAAAAAAGAGAARDISDCHTAVPLHHFIPGSLSYSVAIFLKCQSDITPGAADTLSAFPSRKSMLQLGAAVVLGARPVRVGLGRIDALRDN